MYGLTDQSTTWTVVEDLGPTLRITEVASVSMRKARAGWTVTVRCGPIAVKTRHLTYRGAARRYELGQEQLVETVRRVENSTITRSADTGQPA